MVELKNDVGKVLKNMSMKPLGTQQRSSHFFLAFDDGMITRTKLPSNVRITCPTDVNYTLMFPNHALDFQHIRNCCGMLGIRLRCGTPRNRWTICVVMNISPFSSCRKFIVRDLQCLPGEFFSEWRLGWDVVAKYFGHEVYLDLYDETSFEFLNVVKGRPGVKLCHPQSVIDRTGDDYMQSSFHGPDFVKGVPLVINDPPVVLSERSVTTTTNRRRCRLIANDASIQWKSFTVNTSFSIMQKTANTLRKELEDLVAVPIVGPRNGGGVVALAYISLYDYKVLSSYPRYVKDHNEMLGHMAVKILTVRVLDRGPDCTNVVVSIPNVGPDKSIDIGSIVDETSVAPLNNDRIAAGDLLRLIKVITLPKVSGLFLHPSRRQESERTSVC